MRKQKERECSPEEFKEKLGVYPLKKMKDIGCITEVPVYVFCSLHQKYADDKMRLRTFGLYSSMYVAFPLKKDEVVRGNIWVKCIHNEREKSYDLECGICKLESGEVRFYPFITVCSGYYYHETRQSAPTRHSKQDIQVKIAATNEFLCGNNKEFSYGKMLCRIEDEISQAYEYAQTLPEPQIILSLNDEYA